jgi:hypothetical protein
MIYSDGDHSCCIGDGTYQKLMTKKDQERMSAQTLMMDDRFREDLKK